MPFPLLLLDVHLLQTSGCFVSHCLLLPSEDRLFYFELTAPLLGAFFLRSVNHAPYFT